jgi:hypothetical protein
MADVIVASIAATKPKRDLSQLHQIFVMESASVATDGAQRL